MKQQQWHRILSLILTLAVLFAGAAILPIRAAEPEWSANEDGIWEIDSIEDLQAFSAACANNNNKLDYFKGKTVRLMCDLDLNPGWDASTKAAPANVWTPAITFKGTFDGQGHTISGVYVWRAVSGGNGGSAFINKADGATVQNLRIVNSYFCSALKDYVGSFCSSATNGAVLQDLYSEAIVEGRTTDGAYLNYVGGILGGLYEATASMERCVFAGTVIGNEGTGGLVGVLNSAKSSITMTDCINFGHVDSQFKNSGGIIGFCRGNATLIRCVNAGSVTDKSNFSGALMYVESRSTQLALNLTDCYAVKDTRKDGIIAWHNFYKLTVTYDATVAGIVEATQNTQKTTTHNNLTKTIPSVSDLLQTAAFSGWGAVGDRVVPASVLGMLCTVPMEIGYVQEPTGAAGETAALRLIGKVMLDEPELAAWRSVGFDILVTRLSDGKTISGSVSGTTVFGAILADEASGHLTAYSAAELNAAFLAALTVRGIPTDGTYTLAVRPFAVRADGTCVTNTATILTVTNGTLVK